MASRAPSVEDVLDLVRSFGLRRINAGLTQDEILGYGADGAPGYANAVRWPAEADSLMISYVMDLPNVSIPGFGGNVMYTVNGANVIWSSPYGPCTYSKSWRGASPVGELSGSGG